MGDFNVDLCKSESVDFLNNLSSCGFVPTINRPTRITNTSISLIDNVLTNVNTIDSNVNVVSSGILLSDITDHLPIFVSANYKMLPSNESMSPLLARNYSPNSIENFMSRISNVNWDHVYQSNDANISFNVFSDMFNSICCDYFPFVSVKKRKKKSQTLQAVLEVTDERQ